MLRKNFLYRIIRCSHRHRRHRHRRIRQFSALQRSKTTFSTISSVLVLYYITRLKRKHQN